MASNEEPSSPATQAGKPSAVLERSLSLAAIGLVLAAFGLLLLVVPPFFESFDEAKYVGIGYNVLAGRGVLSVYGTPFLAHSPLWPVVIVAPSLLFGGSPLEWGHLFNAIAGLGVIAVGAYLGWRIRPAAGALAAAILVGFVYLHDLTRTARLDVPAAALALGYLAAGFVAFERRSVRWAAFAGFVLGLAFLIKEIALPFAPTPILAALLWGVPGRTVRRLGGWIVLAAAVVSSWWFAVVADYTGRVYRLGTPAWTLLPIAILVVGGAVAAIGLERLPGGAVGSRLGGPLKAAVARVRGGAPGWTREGVVLALAAAWFAAQVFFYSRSSEARLPDLLNVPQLRHNLASWLPQLSLVAPFSAFGGAFALASMSGADRARRLPMAELLVALICSAPLVWLVLAVGEPPRNYLAQIALAVALGAGGWVWLAERVTRARSAGAWLGSGALAGVAAAVAFLMAHIRVAVALPAGLAGGIATSGLVAWLLRRASRLRANWPAVVVVPAALIFASLLAIYALGHRESASGSARGEAVSQVTAWARGNIRPGAAIAFGSFLGYEMGNELAGRYRIVSIAQSIPRIDLGAPLGIAVAGAAGVDDWIAVDAAPRNVSEFQAFRASTIAARLRVANVAYWIYTIGTDTAAPSILAALNPEDGFTQVAHFTFPIGGTGRPLETYAFRVDLATVSFPPDRLYIAPDALRRLVGALAAASPTPRDLAARLLARVVVVPSDGADPTVMEELRRLAAAGPGG